MDGVAWPMLNTVIAGEVARLRNGRVIRMPMGIAISSTNAVDTSVSQMCCLVALRRKSKVRRRDSMLSRSWPLSQIARPASRPPSSTGMNRYPASERRPRGASSLSARTGASMAIYDRRSFASTASFAACMAMIAWFTVGKSTTPLIGAIAVHDDRDAVGLAEHLVQRVAQGGARLRSRPSRAAPPCSATRLRAGRGAPSLPSVAAGARRRGSARRAAPTAPGCADIGGPPPSTSVGQSSSSTLSMRVRLRRLSAAPLPMKSATNVSAGSTRMRSGVSYWAMRD